jgi:uncharacterized protein (DUF924 family)
MMISADWAGDVLTFWFKETQPEFWFKKDKDFDATIRKRFLALHEVLAAKPSEALFADARTALAAVIVFDQMSRNMFRDTPRAFATDPLAFWIAQAAIAKGFDASLSKEERSFLYLPFEHAEDAQAQERCVALMATLNDPELSKWALAHKAIIDRFGRFPHRNNALGRSSTAEEIEFLKGPNSSF